MADEHDVAPVGDIRQHIDEMAPVNAGDTFRQAFEHRLERNAILRRKRFQHAVRLFGDGLFDLDDGFGLVEIGHVPAPFQ
ncbi:hypothetical protein D3C71_539310 [compost metagenome]